MNFNRKICNKCHQKPKYWEGVCINCYRVERATKKPEIILLRHQVINELGGKCRYCPEGRLGCLDIDHVFGGGPQHRKELKEMGYDDGYAIYRYLIDNKFNCPYELQILCRYCHTQKHREPNRKHGKVKILMRNGVVLNESASGR